MGGSSLAPEVICAWAGVDLVVLDSSDPDVVRRAVETELARTVVVVSSKSGGTVETDSQKRAFEKAFADAGIDPAERIVVVTDPGSPLDEAATAAGYRVFRADPDVGGRFSALSAFGLVPSGLAGADLDALLDQAQALRPELGLDDPANPALQLGALLGLTATRGVDKLVLADAGSAYPGLGDWIEQLVAESTGKHGVGILPVVVESPEAPNADPATEDSLLVRYGPGPAPAASSGVVGPPRRTARRPAAALGVRHRRSPAASWGSTPSTSPTWRARRPRPGPCWRAAETPATPLFSEGSVTVFASPGWLPEGTSSVRDAVAALLDRMDAEHGYLAVQAYLDRSRDSALEDVRPALARRTGRPVTFGWGPRFLHSTGQYHKGGPETGLFLQVTSQPEADLAVPDRPFTFHEFLLAPGRRGRAGPRGQGTSGAAPAPGRPVRPGGGRRPAGRPMSPVPSQPAARPAGPAPAPDRRSVQHGAVRRHRRPLAQEDHAGRLRPRQPRPAPSGVQPGRLRPARVGGPGLRRDRPRLGQDPRPHRVPRGGLGPAGRRLPVRAGRARRRPGLRHPAQHPGGARRGPWAPAATTPSTWRSRRACSPTWSTS